MLGWSDIAITPSVYLPSCFLVQFFKIINEAMNTTNTKYPIMAVQTPFMKGVVRMLSITIVTIVTSL